MTNNVERSGSDRVDVSEIIAEIRARVKSELKQRCDNRPSYQPLQADFDRKASRKAGELVHSEELYYLNTHYTYGQLDLNTVQTHRKGLLGKVIVKFKRKILSIVWENLLRNYFEAEKEFQSQLVRYLNDVGKYVDARDAGNFWELIHKIDYDVGKALDRIDRVADEQSALVHTSLRSNLGELHNNLNQIRSSIDQHTELLKTLDGVTRGLEALSARSSLSQGRSDRAGSDLLVGKSTQPDQSYVLFENRFRGSESEIAERLSIYPPLFCDTIPVKDGATILDIGAGRGELLMLLKNNGMAAYGVDNDPAMVELARQHGQRVECSDVISHLNGLADHSLGGVVAVQVVEHLAFETLRQLINLCAVKVKRSGRIAFETVNPKSLLALSSNYYRDPSHQAPLHPDTLAYLLSLSGLKIVETRYLSPVASESQLQYINIENGMTPRWVETVEKINGNLKQLNEMLYGYQDYCIVAEVN